MDNPKSSQHGNTYILLDLIGVGSLSEVYRCKLLSDQEAEKIIVIKKLLDHASQDKDAAACFIDEARLAALLQHENITQIVDFGEIQNDYFIASEYLFGKDLFSIIQRVKEQSSAIGVDEALLITTKILAGMEYAHNLKDSNHNFLGIVHKTITPGNVYVTYEGEVKIKGFGVWGEESSEACTRIGNIKGEIAYMSPEQLTDETIDHRSDIFSIGILLYEMLSGRRMYVGDTSALIRKCMRVEHASLETVREGLSQEIYAIVNKALNPDKEKRYQSCLEMCEDIELILFSSGQKGRQGQNNLLQELVVSLFADDFEAEKSALYSTIRRFDKIYNNSSEQKIHVISYANTSNDEITFVDATNTLLVVAPSKDDFSGIRKSLGIYHSLSSLAKIVTALAAVAVLGLVYFSSYRHESTLTGSIPAETAVSHSIVGEKGKATTSIISQGVETPAEKTELDENIRSLLQQAEATLAAGKDPDAELELAALFYQEIQKIMPENSQARDGLSTISEKYAEFAERGLQNNYFAAAEVNVQKGLQFSPESSRLLTLYSHIEQEKRELVEQLEVKAQRAMEMNMLTTPADDCAYKYYLEMQKIDRKNRAAKQGILSIAERYAEFAEKSFRSYDLEKSRNYVSKGLKVAPGHRHLRQIQYDLSRSSPGIFFQVVKKNYTELLH